MSAYSKYQHNTFTSPWERDPNIIVINVFYSSPYTLFYIVDIGVSCEPVDASD